ncbi:MAG: Increased rDNA silencing protein [Bogoriella megaspora]|nr:MAG: Increased rDNA silencing protein [Bogoriella megaspora]
MTSVQAQAIAAARQHDLQGQHTGASEAALTGAALAFKNPKVKPKPAPKPRRLTPASGEKDSTTLRANSNKPNQGPKLIRRPSVASRVSTGSNAISTHSTGNSSLGGRTGNIDHDSIPRADGLLAPSSVNTSRSRSPHTSSNIAANVAAARMSPRPQIKTEYPTQGQTGVNTGVPENAAARKLRARQASIRRRASEASMDDNVDGRNSSPKKTDTSPIPPTSSLVNMFEQGSRPSAFRRTTSPAVEGKKPSATSLGTGPQESAAVRKLRARQASISRRWSGVLVDGVPSMSTEPPDISSIPSTKALVNSFESTSQPKGENLAPGAQVEAEAATKAKLPKPKPAPRSPDPVKPPIAPKPRALSTSLTSPETSKGKQQSASEKVVSPSIPLETGNSSDSSTYTSAPETSTKPTPPPPRRGRVKTPSSTNQTISTPINIPARQGTSSANLQKPQSSSSVSPSPSSLNTRPPYLLPNNYSQTSIRRISPHMTGSNMANALVAANLSSRTPSPSPTISPPPLLPPRLKPQHHHLPFSHHRPPGARRTRTLSPPKKGLRTTMREDPSSDSSASDDNPHKRHRHRIVRKHPHKHHEGDRLRWRSEITGAERKRYEGVFASNKGILLVPEGVRDEEAKRRGTDGIHGYVVRDLWSRSRLGEECLREVWDLVAGKGVVVGLEDGGQRERKGWGRCVLSREEFVVGMWLLDQRLKGRKLPIKVGESVWASVRGVGGLTVPKARGKKR